MSRFRDKVVRQHLHALPGADSEQQQCFQALRPLISLEPGGFESVASLLIGSSSWPLPHNEATKRLPDIKDSISRAYCEEFDGLAFTSASGELESTQPLAEALKCVLIELVACERRGCLVCEHDMGADLSWALRMLAHSIIQVTNACLLSGPEKQRASRRTSRARQPMLQCCGDLRSLNSTPEAQLCGALSQVALTCTMAEEQVVAEPYEPRRKPLHDEPSNYLLACYALVLACYWVTRLLDSRAPSKDSAGAGQASERLQREVADKTQEASTSFVWKAQEDWACITHEWAATVHSWPPEPRYNEDNKQDPRLMASIWKREWGYSEAMGVICMHVQPPLDGHFSLADFLKPEGGLFHKAIDSLGLALWEVLDIMSNPVRDRLVHEAEACVKELLRSLKMHGKWFETGLIKSLSTSLRSLAEAVLKAAYIRWYSRRPEDVHTLKTDNMRDMYNDLARGDKRKEARWLSVLIRAAWHHLSANIHPGLLSEQAHDTQGRNLVMGCQCVLYSIWLLAVMHGPRVGRDVSDFEAKKVLEERLEKLHEAVKLPADEGAHFESFSRKHKGLVDIYKQLITGRANIRSALNGTLTYFKDGVLEGPQSTNSQVEWNGLISQMQDIYRTSMNYLEGFEKAGTWLFRMLEGKDEQHHSDILHKLQGVAYDLEWISSERHWPDAEKHKLGNFQRELDEMRREHAERKAVLDEIKNGLFDERGHIQDFKEVLRSIKEVPQTGEGSIVESEETEDKLKQAAAYVQAKLDQDGCHCEVDHPDMLVLWHQVEELRRKRDAEWADFLRFLKKCLVVPRPTKQEVNAYLKDEATKQVLHERLTGGGSSSQDSGSDKEDDAMVTIEAVNKVFEWSVWRRVSVLDTIKGCQQDRPKTPEQVPEKLRETSLLQSTSVRSIVGLENDQPLLFVGREQAVTNAKDMLTHSSGKRHVLLSGPAGIGKTSLGSRVAEQLHTESGTEAGLPRVDLFGAFDKDAVHAALCSAVGIAVKVDSDEVKDEVFRRIRLQLDSRASPGTAASMLFFLDSCEHTLGSPEAAHALADVLLNLDRREPRVRLLMAARATDGVEEPSQCWPHAPASLLRIFEHQHVSPLELEPATEILRQGFGSSDPQLCALAEQCHCVPLYLNLAAGIMRAGRAGHEEIRSALSEAAQHGSSVEVALLRWHKQEHLEALLTLSVFAASFSTRQAEFMLHRYSDVHSLLQTLYRHRLLLATPVTASEQAWAVHPNVQAAMLQLASTPASGEAPERQQHHRHHHCHQQQRYKDTLDSARECFAQCMMAELARCARGSSHSATRTALSQQANFFAALRPAGHDAAVSKAVLKAMLEDWGLFRNFSFLDNIGRVSALLLPSLERLCQALPAAVDAAAKAAGGNKEGHSAEAEEHRAAQTLATNCVVWAEEAGVAVQLKAPGVPKRVLLCMHVDVLSVAASVLDSLGRHAPAAELWQHVVEQRTNMLGAVHCDTLTSRHNLAASWDRLGRHKRAAELLQQVVEDRTRLMGADDHHTVTSKNSLAICWLGRGGYVRGAKLLEEVVQQCGRVFGEDHPDTLTSKGNLAAARARQGRYAQSAELEQQLVEQRTRVNGANHPGTLSIKNNLAASVFALGRAEQGVALLEQVVEGRTRVLGEENPATLNSKSNLATGLARLGRHDQAAVIWQEVLEGHTRVSGADHRATVAIKNSLASSLSRLSMHGQAAELLQQVLEQHTRVLGEENPAAISSRSSLASSLSRLGRHDQAAELRQQVLEQRTRASGADDPATLASKCDLGCSWLSLGKYAQAAGLWGELMEQESRVYGPEHPNALGSKSNLALCLKQLGASAQAAELEQQLVAQNTRRCGPDALETLISMNNLASTCSSLGKHAQAAEHLEHVMVQFATLLGKDHPITLTSMSGLAESWARLGTHARAAWLYEHVQARRSLVLGAAHPNTLQSKGDLASTWGSLGRHTEAAELLEQVYQQLSLVLGADHPYTLDSKHRLAAAWGRLGMYDQAAELQQQVLEQRTRLAGKDHPDTLTAKDHLASTLQSQGKLGEAESMQRQVLDQRSRVLGQEHPESLTSKGELASTWDRLGRHTEAAALQQQVQRTLRQQEAQQCSSRHSNKRFLVAAAAAAVAAAAAGVWAVVFGRRRGRGRRSALDKGKSRGRGSGL